MIPVVVLTFVAAAVASAAPSGSADRVRSMMEELRARLDVIEPTETGILYDRVLPLSGIDRFVGGSGRPQTPEAAPVPPADDRTWRAVYGELQRASVATPGWPSLSNLDQALESGGPVPIAVLDVTFERIRPDAFDAGLLSEESGTLVVHEDPLLEQTAFLIAPWESRTYRGERVEFVTGPEFHVTNRTANGFDPESIRSVEIDFDDGRGFLTIGLARTETHTVSYRDSGTKTIRIRIELFDGSRLIAASLFEVQSLGTATPDDTLNVTASIPYLGQAASGEAYVYLADSHSTLTRPVVVIEGFDLDNSYFWDELYELLNREQLVEDLRALGYDIVVLNFSNATDYVQRNSFLVVELIEQVQAMIAPEEDLVLVGASMGGLASRYALAYMETNAIEHRVETWISFDAPQQGAAIPLGIQYWLSFFADQSDDAADLLAALDSPASRQMLTYHHTDPPGTTGEADPLRATLLADIAAVGDYPTGPRLVSIVNGSGVQSNQGFDSTSQIIEWDYDSIFVDIIGNVWAVPDGINQRIFQGEIDIFIIGSENLDVTVSGTLPYDNAPGGWRNSMQQMDEVSAPYGDIVALHPNHCFIPTTSSLGLDTGDLFFDIAGDTSLVEMSPFDAVYFPMSNEEHVEVTPTNKEWIISEIESGSVSVDTDSTGPSSGAEARIGLVSLSILPNPVSESVRIGFDLPSAGSVHLDLFDASGRRVRSLVEIDLTAGSHELAFDLATLGGRRLSAGTYFVRLQGDGYAVTQSMVMR